LQTPPEDSSQTLSDGGQSSTGGDSPSLILEIDEHRNCLAILESFSILWDLLCSPTSNLSQDSSQALRRALVRIQFFLMHSRSPILSDSDRLDLARIQLGNLSQALDNAEDQRRAIHLHRLIL